MASIPTKITVWDKCTGGYISLAAAFLNQYSEITTLPGGKWILPFVPNVGNVPMITSGKNGTIENTQESLFQVLLIFQQPQYFLRMATRLMFLFTLVIPQIMH